MPPRKKRLYRIVFTNQGKLFELYARSVTAGEIYGFVEVSGILFGERSSIVVDPGEDLLKREFDGVCRTMIPFHAVQRIDEVDREGTGTIVPLPTGPENSTITPFIPPTKR